MHMRYLSTKFQDNQLYHTHQSHARRNAIFLYNGDGKEAIDKMRIGRASDHDGLVAEHFLIAKDMLAELLPLVFN